MNGISIHSIELLKFSKTLLRFGMKLQHKLADLFLPYRCRGYLPTLPHSRTELIEVQLNDAQSAQQTQSNKTGGKRAENGRKRAENGRKKTFAHRSAAVRVVLAEQYVPKINPFQYEIHQLQCKIHIINETKS